MARPIPEPAPVTIAPLPSSRPMPPPSRTVWFRRYGTTVPTMLERSHGLDRRRRAPAHMPERDDLDHVGMDAVVDKVADASQRDPSHSAPTGVQDRLSRGGMQGDLREPPRYVFSNGIGCSRSIRLPPVCGVVHLMLRERADYDVDGAPLRCRRSPASTCSAGMPSPRSSWAIDSSSSASMSGVR